ncbi:uncharacterized protein LOC5517036 isoform X1 [Nematostella vectensis]|uniref:uncharacterized protein LOC5517036 isoform X1 n=2 Tax=Nematostella vectensis TaxID=45351 RepID=UPI0020771EA4|nr:uncharacterized protein LOC5517036 isoform X1 [Nematostella vectensis]
MGRFYYRAKTTLVFLISCYVLLRISQLMVAIRREQMKNSLLERVRDKPLCSDNEAVIRGLRRLTKDLIFIRMTVGRDPDMVRKIESHYNNLQKLLLEIEVLTKVNKTRKPTRLERGEVTTESSTQTGFFCPEVFRGSTYGYPFYRKGFEVTNCTTIKSRRSVSGLVTLIFDDLLVARKTPEGEKIADEKSYHKYLSSFFENLYQEYPGIKAFVLLNNSKINVNNVSKEWSTSIEIIQAHQTSKGETLRKLVNQVNTPYVLLATGVTHFKRVKLERLIRVLSAHKSLQFAGGSTRDLEGHWSSGCLQTKLKNYTLSLRAGYSKSLKECLVCDYLTGPFLAKTGVFKKFSLDARLNNGVYRDLFLRVKSKFSHTTRRGPTVVSCPDAMFHTRSPERTDADLLPFANKHSIRKIVELDGRVRWYGCRRGVIHRTADKCPVREGLLVPPCCLENLADAVKFLMSQCESNSIVCELQEGTLLGAVKMGKVLPWERDADITFLTRDYEKLRSMERVFTDRGYIFRDVSPPWCCIDGREAGGKIEITADGWSIQLYGQHIMDSETLINKGLRPTRVLFSGQWVTVPTNPGEHIRNRYGVEVYRHVEHWMSTGAKSGWEAYNAEAGKFSPCPIRGFHGCIDQYNTDGTIQFEEI